jgi:hypothetical protein
VTVRLTADGRLPADARLVTGEGTIAEVSAA